MNYFFMFTYNRDRCREKKREREMCVVPHEAKF